MKLKIMKVKPKDIEVGDLVLNRDKEQIYLVESKKQTYIHSHNYLSVYFPHLATYRKFLVSEMIGLRTVCRLENKK